MTSAEGSGRTLENGRWLFKQRLLLFFLVTIPVLNTLVLQSVSICELISVWSGPVHQRPFCLSNSSSDLKPLFFLIGHDEEIGEDFARPAVSGSRK